MDVVPLDIVYEGGTWLSANQQELQYFLMLTDDGEKIGGRRYGGCEEGESGGCETLVGAVKGSGFGELVEGAECGVVVVWYSCWNKLLIWT